MSANELSPALSDPSGSVLPRLELAEVLTAHYRAGDGRNPYRTGYGARIRTEYRLTCRGPVAPYGGQYYQRRVYVTCYGNVGSAYVLIGGVPHYLTPDVEKLMQAARDGRGIAHRPVDWRSPENVVPIAGVPRERIRATIDEWERASEGDSGDEEIDAAVDMAELLREMLNHRA